MKIALINNEPYMPQALTPGAFLIPIFKEENEMAENNSNNTIRFKRLAHIGVLDKSASGWTKEVNIVAWNDGPARLDIRDWDESHEHMSRGITLSAEQTQRLMEAVQARNAVGLLQDLARNQRSTDMER